MPGLKGKLTVHFHKACDLKDVQTFGKQDPYCQIYVGQEQYKTRVANDAGKNPVWEQAFLFHLTGVEDAIHIKINDRESLIDRPIGRCDIPLQELIIKASKGPAWFQVHDVNNFQIKAGQISLSAEFSGTGLVASNTATSTPTTIITPAPATALVQPVQQRPIQQASIQYQYQAPTQQQLYQPTPQQYQPPQQHYQQPPSQPVYHQPPPQPIYQQPQPQPQPVYHAPPPQPQPQPVYHAPPPQQPLYQPPPAYAPQPVQPVIYQPPPQQYAPQAAVYQQPVMYQSQPIVQQPVIYAPPPVLQPPIMQTYIPPNLNAYPGAR